MVILDDHAEDCHAACIGPHLHSLHRTGNAGVDRNAQSFSLANFLAHGHRVALGHQRLAGRTNVLLHGDYENIRFREVLYLFALCVPLVFFGVDPSEKGKRHRFSPLSKYHGLWTALPFYHTPFL